MKRRTLLAALLLLAAGALTGWRLLTPTAPHGNPLTQYALEDKDVFTVPARVLERVAAGSYLYVRLEAGGREHWLATLRATAPDATLVRATVFARADRFHSARLRRDFDGLWFGVLRPTPAVQE